MTCRSKAAPLAALFRLPQLPAAAPNAAGDFLKLNFFHWLGNWLLLLSLALCGVPTQATTFTVTNLDDSGPGSLRQAVLDASATIASNTIEFQAGLTGTITLTSGEIAITKRLTINGLGAAVLTISGNQQSRIFNVTGIATIKGLTLKNGKSSDGAGIYNNGVLTIADLTLSGNSATGSGGGILNEATLTVTNSTLSGNSASGNGGGIYNHGPLTVTNSTLSGNQASGSGGGIYNDSTLTVTNSTLSDNSATGGGGGIYNPSGALTATNSTLSGNQASGDGGGIYNSGTLTATNLTLSGNSANNGGGIYNASNSTLSNSKVLDNMANSAGGGVYNKSALTINNSTLAGNWADGGDGGGIMNYGYCTLTIRNSTISSNTARSQGGGIANVYGSSSIPTLTASNNTITDNLVTLGSGIGGGIYNYYGTVTLGNSIVAGNFATNSQNVWDNDSFTSQGSNLFGENGASGVTGFTLTATDLVLAGTIDTAVAELADNGGPTQTQALVTGSPAIDAGDNSLIPSGVTTDQRGTGFPRIVGTKVDIGAVEYGTTGPVYALTVSKSGTGTGTITSTPAGINCGTTCSASFDANTSVVLTAAAVTGSTFANWSGACTGTATTCTVVMAAVKAVTATFNLLVVSVPTATSSAATAITDTSATLNGSVISAGATATATFEFGPTNAYGESLAATPGSVYSSSAVPVSANKTGLTCGSTYHYRVKAVNSAGTGLGTNQTFTTTACPIDGGCGSANGGTFATIPTVNLCSSGIASAVTGTGPWNWSCAGSNGGTTASCSANFSNITYTVTPSATTTPAGAIGGSFSPEIATTVIAGNTTSFSVIPATNNGGYTTNPAVTGTCSQGSWGGTWNNIWTTGPISDNCTVIFSFTAVNSWLAPPNQTVIPDQAFALDVTVKSNSVKVGRYDFVVTYDQNKLRLDDAPEYNTGLCSKGVCPGISALTNYAPPVIDVNTIALTGYDTAGQGPGNDLQLLVIHFKSRYVAAAPSFTTAVSLKTNLLTTTSGDSIGLGGARGATVNVSTGLCGDADGNTSVNIVDALAIARKVVKMPPPPTVEDVLADVNNDGRVAITDAMHIARYSVGLVTPPEVCKIGSAW